MGFVIVLAIAVAVGALVYRLTGGGEVVTSHTDGTFSSEPGAARAGAGSVAVAPDDVQQWAGGEVGERGSAARTASPGPTIVQVSPETAIPVVAAPRSWQSRLSGALGLVVAIGIGAVAIAVTLYGIGMLIARLVSAGTGTGTDVTF